MGPFLALCRVMPLRESSGNADSPDLPRTSLSARCAPPLFILATIAVAIALSLASRFFVPLIFGLFLAAVLHPVVALLRRLHLPQALAAAIALTTVATPAK